jgi:hypothetical protein
MVYWGVGLSPHARGKLNENPSMSSGAVMANKLTFFGRGRTVRYATTPVI